MSQPSLLRNLGLKEAIGIVVGSIIGTGVFLKTATMAQQVGSAQGVMLAWCAAGALSLMGALTYAELGGLFPQTGGEYVYLREAYGPLMAYLYGWTRFWIVTPGSIAAYAIGSATFFNGLVNLGAHRDLVAVFIIAAFTISNCYSVAFNGKLQALITVLKVVMIGGLAAALLLSHSDSGGGEVATHATIWSSFGAAVLSALWAFDGWNNLPMAAGEVREPGVVIPHALLWGTMLVLLVYASANLGYFHVLPFADILASSSTAHPDALPVATRAAQSAFGPGAVGLLSIMFVFSAIGAMNGSMLTGARVPYAMARDGLFFRQLGRVSERTRVPVLSVAVQGVLAGAMAMLGSFDQLTDYAMFASWIFYALMAVALFIFRKKKPEALRPYRTPFYPWLPIFFLISSLTLLVDTLRTSPRESGIGFALIAIGIPGYFLFKRSSRSLVPKAGSAL